MANGRVITGFSKPYIAIYNANSGSPIYTNVQALARGVSVSLSLDTGDTEDFYADNVLAESAGGVFTGGSATITVDGLKDAARKALLGLPAETSITVSSATVKVMEYDDRQVIPYVGLGFVVRVMEAGVTSYVPYALPKVIFAEDGLEASTQEENIDFQTSELTATIMRDDSTNHRWRRIAEEQATEAAAEAVLHALFPTA